jgi:hypothetical protein
MSCLPGLATQPSIAGRAAGLDIHGTPARHRLRHRRVDQLLGHSATSTNRHPPRTRRHTIEHPATLPRENLMIAGTRALAGSALAVALNLWMVQRFEMVRMANGQVLAGALLLLVLGQIAVFLPARRADSILPAEAIRGG